MISVRNVWLHIFWREGGKEKRREGDLSEKRESLLGWEGGRERGGRAGWLPDLKVLIKMLSHSQETINGH